MTKTDQKRAVAILLEKERALNVVAAVRVGLDHRLENIADFADREKPDREEILALVREIKRHVERVASAYL